MAKRMAAPDGTAYMADNEAQKLVKMAKDFFADPVNAAAYRQWHFEHYGCWPEDAAKKSVALQ